MSGPQVVVRLNCDDALIGSTLIETLKKAISAIAKGR